MPEDWPWWRKPRTARAGDSLPEPQGPSDEDLMRHLAAGHQEALGPLYTRYAARIFALASQSLERSTAEEIVQEVFLAVWRKAGTFRPELGPFRPWVFQIAHYRVLNELRRRSRQPQLDADVEDEQFAALPGAEPDPEEAALRSEDQARLPTALNDLPPAQRDAVSLAFLEELSHAEVAQRLHLPLGTTKTRIRAGVARLRAALSPVVAALIVGIVSLAALGGVWWYRSEQAARALDARALALLTSSETVAIRLVPSPGVPVATHAVYRGQTGATIAVLTFDKFPPLLAGQTYQAWARYGNRWISLGTVRPDTQGDARLVIERPELAALPEVIEVMREPVGGNLVPTGSIVVRGQRP